ncbi:LamG domain-containing protein, partial [bacterium]|nr:LamG domain-containing protein [bacterium]
TTIIDSSGNGNNGILHTGDGENKSQSGVVGNALYFDGTDDYVDFNPFGPGETPDVFTFSFWMYNQIPTGTTSHCFIMKPVGGTVANRWEVSFHNGEEINLFLHNGTLSSSISATIPNPQNNWHHIAVLFKADEKEEIYIDGSLAKSGTPTFSGGIGDSDSYFQMGALGWWGDGYNIYFHGLIDEVRIYAEALPEQAIREHYLAGLEKHQNLARK